jgi:hypothetical protein
MELEKRNKKVQSATNSSKKYAKGKLSKTIFENRSCMDDVGGFLEKEAECLKSKPETTHINESPTLQRDEVRSYFIQYIRVCYCIVSLLYNGYRGSFPRG